jgi:hypothetical protein
MRAARVFSAVLLSAFVLAGCATAPKPTTTHPEPPRSARATLQAFFDAWQAEDAAALGGLLVPERQDVTWEFEKLARIEFGEIAEATGQADEYFAGGNAGSGVAREDLAIFTADATFFFEPGQQGSVSDGDTQAWMWILVRNEADAWCVRDWGY